MRYLPGELYSFHHDTDTEVARVLTFLVYLTDVEEGGETIFPFVDGPNSCGGTLPSPVSPYKLGNDSERENALGGMLKVDEYCKTGQVSPLRILDRF
jgi:hypothetical protein